MGRAKLALFRPVVLLILIFCSCSTYKKFSDLEQTPFLDFPGVDQASTLKNIPFKHSWVREGFDIEQYSKVIIAPVSTEFISVDEWTKSAGLRIHNKEIYLEEVNQLAKFTEERLIESFSNTNNNRFSVTSEPAEGVLLVETALLKVQFAHPILNAGTAISPIPGTSQALTAMSDPFVEYAFRIRNALTNEVVATGADRGFSVSRLINLNKYRATSANRDIMENAVNLVVKTLNEAKFKKVRKRRFMLLPW